ncbi:hypothetical protein NQ318_003001 [Aromia moschata]|uniref:Frizzled-4 n=1 Tax=Aromia moschata TaxID=1265417 RepID=A0AAV8YSE4_9CUCU|nr:hypothetical protein NQ318_003001 [Aromia moschata]
MYRLLSYEPFLSHQCSKNIRLFICSVFVPMCSEHVPGPIQACRGLCEKVKADCSDSLRKLGLDWPQELNCSSLIKLINKKQLSGTPELCMQQPEDNEDVANEVVHRSYFSPEEMDNLNTNCPPNTTPFGYKCVPLCKQAHPQLQKSETATFEVWVAVWSIICLIFTTFALITFMIQPKRFRWPARPILYLTACGFVTCTIYLIRWIEGPYTCAGVSLLEKPAESLSCVGISLILLFCDLAFTLWWCVFCFVWFLSAMKEWSTEAIEKIATRLHTTMWIFSAIPMFYILMSNNININYLSGFCEVKTPTLVLFQLFFMLLSCALCVLMLIALRNVRNTLLLAGRSPEKLERLFYRILIISVGICVPHFLYLVCQFYDTFTMALLKLVLRKISIIFATLWVYSSKTFRMWNDLICFCRRSSKDQGKSKGAHFFSLLLPMFHRTSESPPKIGNNSSPLMPPNKNAEERKTVFGLFFSRNGPPMPVTKV